MAVCGYVVGVILASPEHFSITWTMLPSAPPVTGGLVIQYILDLLGYPVNGELSIFSEEIARSSCPLPQDQGE